MENQQPWYYSWIVIGLALFVVWPVGLALLILRLNRSKATLTFGKSQKIILYVVAAFLFIVAIGFFSDENIFLGLLFAAGGGAVIYYNQKAAKRSERFRQYINMIVNQGIESIDTMAAMNNTPYDVVVSDLNKMVEQGILKNAVIDQMSRTVVMPKAAPMVQQPQPSILGGFGVGATPEMITATCSGCGAKMVLAKGSVCSCEYCDTPIHA